MDREPQSNEIQQVGGKRKRWEGNLDLHPNSFSSKDQTLSTLLSLRKHIESMLPEVEVQSINPLIDVRNTNSDVVIMSTLRGYTKAQNTPRNDISGTAGMSEVPTNSGPAANLPKNRLTITRHNHPSSPIRNILHAPENNGSMENTRNLEPPPIRSAFSETIVRDDGLNLIPSALSDVSWLSKGFVSQFLMNSPLRDVIGMESSYSGKRQCIEEEEEKKEEEKKIEEKKKKKKKKEEEEEKKAPIFVCPVCQEQFVHANSTICGHIFCEDCIKKAIRMQKKCPTCRRKLTSRKNQIHRVYLPVPEDS